MTQLLIDADLILFKAVAAAEYEADWGDGVIVASTNLEQAKDMFTSMMRSITDALSSDDVVMVITGNDNFRYGLTDTYKSNRKGNRKPLGYLKLVEWMKQIYPDRVLCKNVLEADDYLGILATTPGAIERIVVSEDKDLQTVPCTLFRQGDLRTISVEEADKFWFYQTLVGDPADGYKGCPGVGPVKADKILGKPGDKWTNVRAAYIAAGLDEESAVLQARLARILRYEDWDSASQSPRLWTP